MSLIYLAYGDIYLEALVYLVLPDMRGAYDAHGEYVIYLLECDMLVAHLVPNGVWALDPRLYDIVDTHAVERCPYGRCELGEELVTCLLCRL